MFGVIYVVFSQFLQIGAGVTNYPVLLLFNLVMFRFFTQATNAAVNSVVVREVLMRKTQFPRLIVPLSVVLTAGFNFLLSLPAIFAYILIYGVAPAWTWLLLPVILALLTILTIGVSILLSSVNVRFRDTGEIWGVATTALLYGSTILYPIESVPESVRDLMLLNPITALLVQARHWVIDPSAPTFIEAASSPLVPLGTAAILVSICALGIWHFVRNAPRAAEQL